MRKFFTTSLIVCSVATMTFAQDFGLKLGANFANVNVENSDLLDPKSKFNFTLGAFAEISVSDKFSVQPEIILSGQGYKFDFEDPLGVEGTVELKQRLNYVTIPVMANLYLSENFYIQAGPYLGILTKAEQNATGTLGLGSSLGLGEGDNKDSFSGTDFGAAIGIGVVANKAVFGIRYQLGLSDINAVEGVDNSIKNTVLNVSFGYKIIDN